VYIFKGYSAKQLITVTTAGLSTACARWRWVEATSPPQLGQVSSTDSQQAIIDQAIDHWRVRLRACIPETGRHFEHLLWCFWYCTVCPRFSLRCFI